MPGERGFNDDWKSLELELATIGASNGQGAQIDSITDVRPVSSITDIPPPPPQDNARDEITNVIHATWPIHPSLERPTKAPSAVKERDVWSNAPAALHTPTIAPARPDNNLPTETELTPLRAIHPLFVRESKPPSPEGVFASVNALMPFHELSTTLRAPTRVMDKETKNSLGPDRPKSDAPPAGTEVKDQASLEELAAMTDSYAEDPEVHLEPIPIVTSRETILPSEQITALKIAKETPRVICTNPPSIIAKVLESIIIDGVPVHGRWCQEVNKVVVEDESLLERTSEQFITDPKEPWWKRWGNKIKKAATAITSTVRETLSEIFTFRTSTRRAILGILAGAVLGTVATQHHKAPTTEAHQDVPVVHVQTTTPTNSPMVDTVEQQVTQNPDQTPLVVHAATVTVDEHSPHVTFVQALSQFLTSNGARAKLGTYHHHTGDAIRVLHGLEQNNDLAATAYQLRQHTHRGDHFHFAVMSDGSVQLGHWSGRHSQSNRLPAPITFRLPQH